MAKNKSSKFGVADNLKYQEDFSNQIDLHSDENNFKFQDLSQNITVSKTKKITKRKDAYRFSLYLDQDLGEYVNYIKFKHKKSITDFFNDIVREKMERDISWKNLKK